MNHPEVLLLAALRVVAEVALFALLGQGLLAVLAGRRRAGNPVYQLFQLLTRPVITICRRILPSRIIDAHLPWVAFFLLFWIWMGLAYLKRWYCTAHLLICP